MCDTGRGYFLKGKFMICKIGKFIEIEINMTGEKISTKDLLLLISEKTGATVHDYHQYEDWETKEDLLKIYVLPSVSDMVFRFVSDL